MYFDEIASPASENLQIVGRSFVESIIHKLSNPVSDLCRQSHAAEKFDIAIILVLGHSGQFRISLSCPVYEQFLLKCVLLLYFCPDHVGLSMVFGGNLRGLKRLFANCLSCSRIVRPGKFRLTSVRIIADFIIRHESPQCWMSKR